MSPFSRGYSVLLRLNGAQVGFARSRAANKSLNRAWESHIAFNHPRFFSNSRDVRYASKKKDASSPRHKVSKPAEPIPGSRPNGLKLRTAVPKPYEPQTPRDYESFNGMDKLLRRATPTLLYQGPPQGTFTAVCFTTGVLALASAAYVFWAFYGEVVFETTTQMTLVRVAEGAGGVCLMLLGSLALFRPLSLIKSITAVPVAGVASRQLALDIESQPVLPFRSKGRIIRRLSSELHLDQYLVSSSAVRFEAKEATHAIERHRGREGRLKYILLWPLRKFADGFGIIFFATQKMFSRQHLRYIRIPGEGTWKLDLAGAWALENGRGECCPQNS